MSLANRLKKQNSGIKGLMETLGLNEDAYLQAGMI